MRPIASSPVPLKVFESQVLNSIGSITARPSDPYQFAHKAKRRPLDAASSLTHAISAHLDKGCKTFKTMFLDFSNTCVTLPRQGLFDKFVVTNPLRWLMKWVLNYFTGRANNKVSSASPNNCGVLQGAVLSPFFFALHTSDLYSESLASFLK